jgi:uncharacterized protein
MMSLLPSTRSQAPPLTSRMLRASDEAMLRDYWAAAPHAHLFAIPDLDHLGWDDSRLTFQGWFAGDALVGYLMLFGRSAQWSYEDERVARAMARALARAQAQFVTVMERVAWPVLDQLVTGEVGRYEQSTVARLTGPRFNRAFLRPERGRARQASLDDLDALTAVHVAAPDQFNNFDYPMRRQMLRGALTDKWRRIFLAETLEGEVAASAQTSAEGKEMAVIGGVVTHPALRRQGYATAATAHLCAALLDEGREPYLFYRRGNAPAARIYEKLGFEPLGDALIAELEWPL